jgi:hypothetical protein
MVGLVYNMRVMKLSVAMRANDYNVISTERARAQFVKLNHVMCLNVS